MYIRAGEGLGQYTIKKNGHERVKWSMCSKDGTRKRWCGVTFRIKFRHAFGDFRKEMERAFRRWMTGPRAQMLTKKLEGTLKAIHKNMMDQNTPANTLVEVKGILLYRGPDGPKQEWRVVDFLTDYDLMTK
jgi:hypothetical protein